MTKINISSNQIRNLVFLQYIATSIILVPSIAVDITKQNAWITAIIGSMFSIIMVLIYNNLADKMKDKTILEYIESVFGKYIGKLISISFILFLTIACATQIWITGSFLSTLILHETPQYVIHIIFMIAIAIASKLGLEVLARSSELVTPLIVISFFITILLLLNEVDFNYMFPILEDGIQPVFKSVIPFMTSTSFTLIALFIFFPANVDNLKESKKAFLTATILGTIVLLIVIDFCILVLGPEITARHMYPTHILMKKVQLGEFIQRIEIIVAMLWFLATFYKLFIYFYGLAFGISQMLKLNDYRILVLPLAMLMVILSIIVYPSNISALSLDAKVWDPLVTTFGFALPIILLTVGKIRGK
ncbi:GerAB/ArcD/ProY family transporter [Senegalia sp. (in: firmicutes)]|uniref:GerAB/ArcD/ProY family transporter n=1 Tax=Senegalia sp. (in: firmicutes) TaxID=1924098 RepID=UPI003F9A4CA6